MNLQELLKKEEQLTEELRNIRTIITESKVLLACEKFGIHIGCVVEDIHTGRQMKITRIDVLYWDLNNPKDKPSLQAKAIKKDGTWGIKELHLYNGWKVIARKEE